MGFGNKGTDHALESLEGAVCREDSAVESDFGVASACRGGLSSRFKREVTLIVKIVAGIEGSMSRLS